MGCKGVFIIRPCLHDGECELKKRLNFCNNTKYLLPFGILYLNAEVGGLSMRLKIKKRKKKIKIKTTKAKKKKEKKNKRLSPGWDSNHDRLRGKARIISTRLLYHMATKQIC